MKQRRIELVQQRITTLFHQRAPAPPVGGIDGVWSSRIGAHIIRTENDRVFGAERLDVQIAEQCFNLRIAAACEGGVVTVPGNADRAGFLHQITDDIERSPAPYY